MSPNDELLDAAVGLKKHSIRQVMLICCYCLLLRAKMLLFAVVGCCWIVVVEMEPHKFGETNGAARSLIDVELGDH